MENRSEPHPIRTPTSLQVWLVAALNVLNDARADLDVREYETLLDIVATRLAREYVRLFLQDRLNEERAHDIEHVGTSIGVEWFGAIFVNLDARLARTAAHERDECLHPQVDFALRDGSSARYGDPASWASFAVAFEAVDGIDVDGVGFVFSADDPYCGLDLDDRMSPSDRVWVIGALASYTETSVSGAGQHVIVRAALNGHGRHPEAFGVFDRARYFVMTGAHVAGTPETVVELTDGRLQLVAHLAESRRSTGSHRNRWITTALSTPCAVPVSDLAADTEALARAEGTSLNETGRLRVLQGEAATRRETSQPAGKAHY